MTKLTPSPAMVEAAAKSIYGCDPDGLDCTYRLEDDLVQNCYREQARAALEAAFAAAVEAGEAKAAFGYDGFRGEDNWQVYTALIHRTTRDFLCLILRLPEGGV